jgi:hypothetical protein
MVVGSIPTRITILLQSVTIKALIISRFFCNL